MPLCFFHRLAGSRFMTSLAAALAFGLLAAVIIPGSALALDEAGPAPDDVQPIQSGTEETPDPAAIKSLETLMEFGVDGSATITEKYVVDFSKAARHGIYRNLPSEYFDQNNKKFALDIKILGVTDEKGQPWKYTITEGTSDLSVKIGDPDITIQKIVTYNLKYAVKTPVIMTDDGAELFWNVTGTEWAMPINTAKIKITLPSLLSQDQILLNCYTGPYGSKESLCKLRMENDGTIQGQTVLPLKAYEGFTIQIHFPPNYFDLPAPVPATADLPATAEENLNDIDPVQQLIQFKFFAFLWNLLLALP